MRDVRTLAVLGAGDMGHGIAELAALKGFDVRVRDVSPEALERASGAVRASLDKMASRSRVTKEAADEAFGRIRFTTDLGEAVGMADLVVEAIPERLDIKRVVLREVEALAPPRAVLATNTSAIRIGEVARDLREPGRLVGMHFFNPVMLMDLVEVIPSPRSTREAVATVEAVARRLGKTVVTLRRDTPGFVTSRLIGTWVGAAILAADHKLGDREAIDAAMRFRAGFPMGPFELADYTGLDVSLHVSDYLADRLGDAYRPSETLRALVDAGHLGKKTGRGFHEWDGGRLSVPVPARRSGDFDPALVMSLVVNEACKLLEQGVASARDIDLAMRQGCAFPKGPFEWADEVGVDAVVKALYTLEEATGGHPLAAPYETLLELLEEGRLRPFKEMTLPATPEPAPEAAPESAPEPAAEHAPEPVAEPAQEPAAEPPVAAPVAAEPQGSGVAVPVTTTRDLGPAATAITPKVTYETLLVEVDAQAKVGIVLLNRPHRLHALNATLLRELRDALRAMEEDASVRVVLLGATGDKAFCAGADLTDVAGATPATMARLARAGHLLCLEMEKMDKPIVAAVNGHALGGGLELTLPADFRVAARRATFALPEVTLGLLPAMGGTQRLPKLLGLSRAKEIAMLGERFGADKALEMGLVHRVFDNETFERDARAFAAHLATRAPLALGYAKQLLNAAPTTDILAGMEAEATAFGVLASTEDVLEGVSSSFARKSPSFSGK